MKGRGFAGAVALSWSLVALAAHAQNGAAAANLVDAAATQPFNGDDLLWLEVRSGPNLLAESVNVYASRTGVFVPIGELARVLDIAVGVFPSQRRAEGWVLSPDRKLTVDLATGKAVLAGQEISVSPDQAAIYADDLYLRIDVIEQLLPVRLKPDTSAQVLELTPLEPLPFQQRLERDQRRSRIGLGAGGDRPVEIATPYRAFTAPAFDVNIGGQTGRDGRDQSSRYDIRAAGDLLWAGLEAWVGSDDDARLSDSRITLSRRDRSGHALGPLGGTHAGIGDVYTPSLALGVASISGRGLFYTSAPRDSLDIGTPLDLRGELAVGEEVELYVNEILYGSQSTPVQGQYEFLDVPLSYGLNTLRLVFYGPHGETRETVRRINFGAGQVEQGRLILRLGAVEQGRTLLRLSDDPSSHPGIVPHGTRLVAGLDYGLSSSVTLAGGIARFEPIAGQPSRSLATIGLRTSLGPFATQIDAGWDDQNGQAIAGSFAGRISSLSLVGRHAEYRDGFIDETRQLGLGNASPLRRASDFRADGQIQGPHSQTVPWSLNLRRLERSDNSAQTNAELRASTPIGRLYASSSIAWEEDKRADATRTKRWVGATDVATLVARRLQLRSGLTYRLSPEVQLETGYLTADWQLRDNQALRFGMVRSLGSTPITTLQASHIWRARRFDLAVNSALEAETGEWRVGFQLGFGFGYDPVGRSYRLVRSGGASGGAVAIDAWIDANDDGVRQRDEEGVSGIVADVPTDTLITDARGLAYAPGLGDPGSAIIRLNTLAVEDPYLAGGPTLLSVEPRPGRTVIVNYPMQRSAEIEVRVVLERAADNVRPLSAVDIELVGNDGTVFNARSDHAGIAFIDGVPPGEYRVCLNAEQAATLGLTIKRESLVHIPPTGGFIRAGTISVSLKGTAS
ncbi:hypothetical protein [Brevundimonas vesicularis]|uniref:hypothetical protein n=1 Tax=Brevundimonas vesicularis TaxID=41276 RepID=UPI0038D44DDE